MTLPSELVTDDDMWAFLTREHIWLVRAKEAQVTVYYEPGHGPSRVFCNEDGTGWFTDEAGIELGDFQLDTFGDWLMARYYREVRTTWLTPQERERRDIQHGQSMPELEYGLLINRDRHVIGLEVLTPLRAQFQLPFGG